MKFGKLVAAVVGLSLMTTPALAAGNDAASARSEVAPAPQSVNPDGQQIYGASVILQVGIVVAAALAAYLIYKAVKKKHPASP